MRPLKDILKRIFPVPFLKGIFLVYNKVKITTIDRLLFPEYPFRKEQFLLYRKGFPIVENRVSLTDIHDDRVRSYMRQWSEWTQEEFVFVLDEKCLIEPDFGWAIVRLNRLVYYSLGVSRTWFQKKPSLRKLLGKKQAEVYSKVISLRDSGEENYFHFYNDVLGKLFLLLKNGVEIRNVPLVISKRLWDKPYFQTYYEVSELLQSLQWIVQDQQYISCQSAIFCKPLTITADLWMKVTMPLLPFKSKVGNRKIFLVRGKQRLRFIENDNDIEVICREFGFEKVDTDHLTLIDQIRLLSEAKVLVGIHGAGLTNMIFCQEGCRVLELFPPPEPGYLPYHYIMLAKMKGFSYQALIGDRSRSLYSGGFYLPPQALRNAMERLVHS